MPIALGSVLGCWLHERWRAECALASPLSRLSGIRWQDLCNRHETLLPGGDSESRRCDWNDSSLLTVSRVFPPVGARLLAHCLRQWPVALSGDPLHAVDRPLVSVILPVGGAGRVSQFQAAVRTFSGQSERSIELIAVEHSTVPAYRAHCPPPIRYLHLPQRPEEQFNKSAAMNAGVRQARAEVVLLHDADALVPRDYVRSTLGRLSVGWEAVRPVRLLFHLDQFSSEAYARDSVLPRHVAAIEENNPGISTAVRRDVYWGIGGHDERFEGWGGEDNEFLDRLQTRKLFPGAYAPVIHHWHPPAAKKASGDRNRALAREVRAVPASERISRLTGRA